MSENGHELNRKNGKNRKRPVSPSHFEKLSIAACCLDKGRHDAESGAVDHKRENEND
jgi:hypothetical protein